MWGLRARRLFDGRGFVPGGALVLVEADRIVGVEAGDAPPPDGCPVEEVAGTLLPGLVDTHVHLCADGVNGALDRLAVLPDTELAVGHRGVPARPSWPRA